LRGDAQIRAAVVEGVVVAVIYLAAITARDAHEDSVQVGPLLASVAVALGHHVLAKEASAVASWFGCRVDVEAMRAPRLKNREIGIVDDRRAGSNLDPEVAQGVVRRMMSVSGSPLGKVRCVPSEKTTRNRTA
jgi:hypothetical protein